MPETSIVIRTFNEKEHIGKLLRTLQGQTYQKYEVVIVDSGSSDGTVEIVREFPVRLVQIKSRDFTFGHALNVGGKAARGKYLVFVSAHVLPATSSWLELLVAPFADPKVAMVYGRQKGGQQSKYPEQKDFWRLFSKMPDNPKVVPLYANNANAAVRKDVWEHEPFDEYLFGLEDIDWARKVAAKGFHVKYEPNAPIYHLHDESWPQVFNRYRREAIAAVRIGLPCPPQCKLAWWWLAQRLIGDVWGSSLWSRARLEEIVRFRYYQWKGSRVGWRQGQMLRLKLDLQKAEIPKAYPAVIITAPRQVEIQQVSMPQLAPGDLLIKVAYVGVSSADIDAFEGAAPRYPIIPGHECVGTIARIGANNRYQEHFSVGERVLCEAGSEEYAGAYGAYVRVPGDRVRRISDGLDMQVAIVGNLSSAETMMPLAEFARAWDLFRSGKHSNVLLTP